MLVVAPDTENAPDYSSTDFLKLSGPNGTWNTKFGGQDGAGKGVVVGVIDTGYTPSSPFFAGEEVQPLVGDPVVGVPTAPATARSRCSSPTATRSSGNARRAKARARTSTAPPATPRSSARTTSPRTS